MYNTQTMLQCLYNLSEKYKPTRINKYKTRITLKASISTITGEGVDAVDTETSIFTWGRLKHQQKVCSVSNRYKSYNK